MSQRWVYSVATVATSRSSRPAPSRYRRPSCRRSPMRAVLPRERHQHRAALDRGDAGGEQHVRRADDLHVEAVRVVPPVVERRRRQHRERAPDADPCAERRAESPEADRRARLRRRPGECGRQRDDSRRSGRRPRRPGRWPMCAGVQNVSRPIVRCHEMSHITPRMTLVDANSTA